MRNIHNSVCQINEKTSVELRAIGSSVGTNVGSTVGAHQERMNVNFTNSWRGHSRKLPYVGNKVGAQKMNKEKGLI